MRNVKRILILSTLIVACSQPVEKVQVDFYTSELFKEAQLQSVFADSKTFVDCVPRRALSAILADYEAHKSDHDFNIQKFISDNFDLPDRPQSTFLTDTLRPMQEHITNLWPVLTRNPDTHVEHSSLLPLPNQYVVPGGRFSEVYYWDSYFTMLGLKTQDRFDLIRDMVSNFAFLVDSVGFIPNGNRNYYLSRSQPPFFSLMVNLLAEKDTLAPLNYLPQLQKEYAFWMNGQEKLQKPGDEFEHVVMLSDGSIMNRYFDKRAEPRPEAYKEDVRTAQEAGNKPESGRNPEIVYKAIRSAAESGWDFSSRWLADGKNLTTIETTNLIPVDLNCLLYHLERMIAAGYKLKNDDAQVAVFNQYADARRRAMLTFCWDPDQNFFFDYNFRNNKRSSVKSLAGVYPLFFRIGQPEMAQGISKVIEKEFLKPGGLTTTLTVTGEQWDAPNGWAPLQWMAYKGFRNYGIDALANEIRNRWLRQNLRVYKATGKMMEKYNVMDTTLLAGGGEYPNQDGFGWTNGVALAFMAEK